MLFLAPLLFAASMEPADLRLDRVLESLTGTHKHYTQYLDNLPVDNAARVETITRDGTHTVEALARRRPAGWSAGGPPAVSKLSRPTPDARLVYLNVNGEARLSWRFTTQSRPLEPYAHWIDASTGETLQILPLFWTAKARVFSVNPVAKLNDPTLKDDNNASSAVPDAAYDLVDLQDLPASGPLAGPNAMIVDAESPQIPPVDVSQPLLFDRGQRGFEDVNAYFQVDRSQRYIQSLGYTGSRRILGYAIPIDAHAANGTDNSYYIGGLVAGRGTLFYGEGGVDDAEDADLVLHEMGHAIQDWIAPGTFNGAPSSEARALGEGFGDYWAFSSTYEETTRSGRDPFCIADWDPRCAGDDPAELCGYAAGADCLRRVDSTKTMLDFQRTDTAGTEHRNGEIWSSALREIFLAAGKRTTDTIVLESHFGVPPNPTYAAMARRMLDADRILFGGANASVICAAMSRRGILTDCNVGPRGEATWFQSADHGVPIPDGDAVGITSTITVFDTRRLARVAVHVDIAHPARGDLRIVLTAPDGTQVLLQNSSLDRTPNLRATFGVDALPAQSLDALAGRFATGVWKLSVADVLSRDAGTLVSWSLVLQFEGDAPQAARPSLPSAFPSKFIPVVAHLFGANGSQFVSDIYLFNAGEAQTITLVFTPSGADGTQRFSAVKVELNEGESVVLEDVVPQLFQTVGSGTIEVQGDLRQVIVSSSTYDRTRGVGQTVPSARAGEGERTIVPISVPGSRVNLGFAETAGRSGMVRVDFDDRSTPFRPLRVPIAPFSHVQVSLPDIDPPHASATVSIEQGDARVVSYASAVDATSGDPMFIPAGTAPDRLFAIPVAIEAPGALGSMWSTDLWLYRSDVAFYPDVLGGTLQYANFVGYFPHALASLYRGTIGHVEGQAPLAARIYHTRDGARFGEYVGALQVDAIQDRDLYAVHVESSPTMRTNFGITEVREETALVEVTLLDAGGKKLASTRVLVAPKHHVQLSLSSLYGGPVTHGVLRFREIGGSARIIAYASVVNNVTNDFAFLVAE